MVQWLSVLYVACHTLVWVKHKKMKGGGTHVVCAPPLSYSRDQPAAVLPWYAFQLVGFGPTRTEL